jgi:hypothetical protein
MYFDLGGDLVAHEVARQARQNETNARIQNAFKPLAFLAGGPA